MSFYILSHTLKVHLPPSEKLVLMLLAYHARQDDGSDCWPSVARLASESGLDRRTVQRVLARLAAQGFVEFVRRRGGRGKSTSYRVTPLKGGTTPLFGARKRAALRPERAALRPVKGGTTPPHRKRKQIDRDARTREEEQEPVDFEAEHRRQLQEFEARYGIEGKGAEA